jgi:hypothetical protein
MNEASQHQQRAAKYSSAGVKNHILQRPPQPWKYSTKDGDTPIAFVVEFAGEQRQQQQLRWLTRDNQLFAHDTQSGNLSVVMSEANTRVE